MCGYQVDDEKKTRKPQEEGNPHHHFALKGLVFAERNGAAGAHFSFVLHGATVDWARALKVRRATVAKPGAAHLQRTGADATQGEGPVALGLRGRRFAVVAREVGRQRLQKHVSRGRLRSWWLLLPLLGSWWLLPLLGAGPVAARSSGVSRRQRGVVVEGVEEGGVVIARMFRAAAVALRANKLQRGAGGSLLASAIDAEGHARVWTWRLECATGRKCAQPAASARAMVAAPPSTHADAFAFSCATGLQNGGGSWCERAAGCAQRSLYLGSFHSLRVGDT